MTEERGDELMRELEQALAVEPSPGFAARVRTAVAAAPKRRPSWAGLAWAGVAAAAVIGLVVVAWPAPQVPAVQPGPATIASAAPNSPAPSRATAAAAPATPPAATARHPRRTRPAAPVHVAASHEPDVLVPDDQRRALVRLLASLRQGRGGVPQSVAPRFDDDGKLVPPAPVEIAPVVIPLLPPLAPDGEPRKDIR